MSVSENSQPSVVFWRICCEFTRTQGRFSWLEFVPFGANISLSALTGDVGLFIVAKRMLHAGISLDINTNGSDINMYSVCKSLLWFSSVCFGIKQMAIQFMNTLRLPFDSGTGNLA